MHTMPTIPASRLGRALSHPLKTTIIQLLRRANRTRPLTLQLWWGQTFHALIPEAVSSLLWKFRIYEPETTAFFTHQLQPGDTVLDVGAHYGYFSLLASHCVGAQGRVVAVEAMPSTFAQLGHNLVASTLGNVTGINRALYNTATTLNFRDLGAIYSSLNSCREVRSAFGAHVVGEEVAVPATTGDALIAELGLARVDLIKIDTESSEEFVIEGFEETLRTHKPVLVVELGGAGAQEKQRIRHISQHLRARGYTGYVIGGTLLPLPEDHTDYANIAFVHPDRPLR